MPEAIQLDGVRQQFQEQIAFFRNKLNLPTESWRDIERSAHDRAFMVAGAAKADLLVDLRSAVGKAIEGSGLAAFRKDFAGIVEKQGWTGWTGEGSRAGTAWRTKVIYQTNIATSYASGRRAQLKDPALLARRPFWRYVHNDSVAHPRPQHKAWGDMRLTLPHDHPFWEKHFPPNGWGCHCYIVAVAAPLEGDSTEPPEGWDDTEPATGTPEGVDVGFDYAPGARADVALRQFVQDKLISYPPAISKALSVDVNRHISAEANVADYAREVLGDQTRTDPQWMGFVEDSDAVGAAIGADVRGYTVLLPADAVRHVEANHAFDGGSQRPAEPQDYARVEALLNEADSLQATDMVGKDGHARLVATKVFDGETYRGIFEARPGKRNRAVVLVTLIIKTATS